MVTVYHIQCRDAPIYVPAVDNRWSAQCLQFAPHQANEPNQGSRVLRDPKVWPCCVVEVLQVARQARLREHTMIQVQRRIPRDGKDYRV